MRVLHIHNEIECKGGAEVYLQQLQELLPTIGHKTWWMAIQPVGSMWRWCHSDTDWKIRSSEALKNEVLGWIDSHEIDLICIHNLFDNRIVDKLSSSRPTIKFSHSPVVVCPGKDKYWRYSNTACTIPYGAHCFFHAYSEGCTNRHPKRLIHDYNFVKHEVERARTVYKKVIVMSQYNSDRLSECNIPENKITINPYFTEYSHRATNIETDVKRLLFIGRLINGKGVQYLIEAVENILRERPEVSLDIIGDGPLSDSLKESVKRKQLGASVRFLGWLPRAEIRRYLNESYLLVFPSVYPESFGIVGIEAMMAAKPVVGFDVGGVSTWLRHGESGFLCSPRDTKSLEAYIRKLIDDPQLYDRFCDKAHQLAIENFLPDKHLTLLDEVFTEAVLENTNDKLIAHS